MWFASHSSIARNSKCHSVREIGMKNAFEYQNVHKDASRSSHRRPGANEVITAASSSQENVQIAPIFLPRSVNNRCKRVWVGQQRVDFTCQSQEKVKTVQDAKHSCDPTQRQGGHRERLPPPEVTRCLEEIQTFNPAFPAKTVFSNLKEKSRALFSVQHSQQTSFLQNHSDHGSPERVPKRPRMCLTAGSCAVAIETAASVQDGEQRTSRNLLLPRSSQLSCTRRLKQQNAAGLNQKSEGELDGKPNDPQKEFTLETLLWTDKYGPQHSSEVIGNPAAVKRLHSWLKKWKQKASSDETRVPEEEDRDNSKDVWDCGDFRGETEADDRGGRPLCNTVLITGPPGVGKTASVYACAQELGFKVFEVNCSSQRSGCQLVAQLKEATQSHLVEISGMDSLKPAYFNHYTTQKPDSLPVKSLRPKRGSSNTRKRAARKLGRSDRKQKRSQAAVTLADFFKVKAKADRTPSGGHLSGKAAGRTASCSSSNPDDPASGHKKTATSLILFEEVDVIFDDDVGFLSAIKTFMTTTKRPVILTTNDPSFRERFNGSLEEIIFKVPAKASVCSYLQVVALAEGTRLKSSDAHDLLRLSGGDVRRCLLQLQLWACSGGGQVFQPTCQLSSSVAEDQVRNAERRDCYSSCAATMLGLSSITADQLLDIVKCPSSSEVEKLQQLLADSWRLGLSLLYSNLELLLPTQHTGQLWKPGAGSPPIQLRTSAVRKNSKLSRRRHRPLVDSSGETQRSPPGGGNSRRDQTALATAACLDALTDFFDCMSFLDATAPPVWGPRGPETFLWTGAEIHDGMQDEMREGTEEAGWRRHQERLLDVRAAIEGLSCRTCTERVHESWRGSRESPTSSRPEVNFGLQAASAARFKLSRTLLHKKPFGLLGNRAAVTVDYMPTLRFMCRLQKSQQQKDEPDGFLHDLNSTKLGLSDSTILLLAKDFTEESENQSVPLAFR